MRNVVIVILWGSIISASSFAKTIDKKFHQQYDVKEGASLYLKHGDGNVDIAPWSRDVVDIDIVYRATISGLSHVEPKDFEVEFEKRGDHISVIAHEPRIIGLGSHRIEEYQYTIKAPSYVLLDLEGVDGNVAVEAWDNDIKVRSVDGNINLQDVEATMVDAGSIDGNIILDQLNTDVKAKTVDGNIDISDVTDTQCTCNSVDGNITVDSGSGSFDVGSVDGNINLRGISIGDLEAQTSDGRIDIELQQSENPDASLRTGDGRVHVRLAAGTSVTIDVKTGDGRIRTDLSPVAELSAEDDSFHGAINGGHGSLTIRTGDGGVTIVEE